MLQLWSRKPQDLCLQKPLLSKTLSFAVVFQTSLTAGDIIELERIEKLINKNVEKKRSKSDRSGQKGRGNY